MDEERAMKGIVSATEARVRFGELLQRVSGDGEPVVVERGGRPMVVVLSVDAYARMEAAASGRGIGEPAAPYRLGLSAARSPLAGLETKQGQTAQEDSEPRELTGEVPTVRALAALVAEGLSAELCAQLDRSAQHNHRSLSAEILYRIEQSLRPRRLPAAELERRLQGIHARLEGPAFSIEEIDAAKREGRP
jgi:prevent-host-death family protein